MRIPVPLPERKMDKYPMKLKTPSRFLDRRDGPRGDMSI